MIATPSSPPANSQAGYLLAAAQGDEKAKDKADLVELVLLPNQIADGKRRAENFKPLERPQP